MKKGNQKRNCGVERKRMPKKQTKKKKEKKNNPKNKTRTKKTRPRKEMRKLNKNRYLHVQKKLTFQEELLKKSQFV